MQFVFVYFSDGLLSHHRSFFLVLNFKTFFVLKSFYIPRQALFFLNYYSSLTNENQNYIFNRRSKNKKIVKISWRPWADLFWTQLDWCARNGVEQERREMSLYWSGSRFYQLFLLATGSRKLTINALTSRIGWNQARIISKRFYNSKQQTTPHLPSGNTQAANDQIGCLSPSNWLQSELKTWIISMG